MLTAAVIPALNEGENICRIISLLQLCQVNIIIPVINGSTDNSVELIGQLQSASGSTTGSNCQLCPLVFAQPLGVDIPRAAGSLLAVRKSADAVLFVDGDMCGLRPQIINNLLNSIYIDNVDVALTDCYPYKFNYYDLPQLASSVLYFRRRLNKTLEIYQEIGSSTPSHGPHALSAKVLKYIPTADLAVPPLILVHAVRNNLKIKIAAAIPHIFLGSPYKDDRHNKLIAATIIGDCLEGQCLAKGFNRSRQWQGQIFNGYAPQRRFDLLDELAKSI